MLIYGTNSAKIKREKLPRLLCPNCSVKGRLELELRCKHVHLFWIPVFPIGKSGLVECSSCQYVEQSSQMSMDIKREYNLHKGDCRAKLWQFSGLFLVAIFIVWMSFFKINTKKKELMFLDQPQIGDLYYYKLGQQQYSIFKVADLKGDSVFVVANKMQVNKLMRTPKLNLPENYTDSEVKVFDKQALLNMYNDKIIYDVNR